MKKIWKIIKFYGLWTIPISIVGMYEFLKVVLGALGKKAELNLQNWIFIFVISFLISFRIATDNITKKKHGKPEEQISAL